ncbi:MAG: hypothetical protein RLP09_36300 [Sandaracinaceae bacterium]
MLACARFPSRHALATGLLLMISSSCTLDRSGAGPVGECRFDTDCVSGLCVNGTCVPLPPADAAMDAAGDDDATTPDPDAGFDAEVPDARPDSGPPTGPLLDYSSATFTRASVATHFDRATGVLTHYAVGEPRILVDGAIYVEGERTNFVNESESFGTWIQDESTLAEDAEVAPDGATSAERWLGNAEVGARAFLLGGPWGGFGRPHASISIFAKAAAGTETFRQYWRHASAHTFGPDHTVGTQWERFSESSEDMERNGVAQASSTASRALGIWGAQAEVGTFASQYIPSAGTRGTRVAETVVFDVAPTPLTAQPWTVELTPEASSEALAAGEGSWTVFEFSSFNDSLRLRVGAGAVRVSVRVGGSVHAETMPLTFDAHTTLTVSVDPSSGRLTVSGAAAGDGTTSASGWTFPAGALRVGSGTGGAEAYFGAIGQPRFGAM